MAKTVVGLFSNFHEAEGTIRELRAAGFSQDDISLVANNANAKHALDPSGMSEGPISEGVGTGAVSGTAVGGVAGLLAGLGALTIPGIGPAVAAGTLATTLGMTAAGAGVGAAAGGLVGGLIGAGVPDEDANVYAEGVRRGDSLVMVSTNDENAEVAADIMRRYNVADVNARATEYRTGGWSYFDETANPYPTGEVDLFGATRRAVNQPHLSPDREPQYARTAEEMEHTARRQTTTTISEQPALERAVGADGFDMHDSDFRNHYQQHYADRGGTYDQYIPIYRYGYELGADERYRSQDWNVMEPQIQSRWEERNPGTWSRFKDTVRYAWDQARNGR